MHPWSDSTEFCEIGRGSSDWSRPRSSVRSESSLNAFIKQKSLVVHWEHSEDTAQTGRKPRLIWIFAFGTLISFSFLLPCRISYVLLLWIILLFMYRVCHAALSVHCSLVTTSWLSCMWWVFFVFLSLSHVMSWVRCGIWLYRFLIFAFFLIRITLSIAIRYPRPLLKFFKFLIFLTFRTFSWKSIESLEFVS